MALDQRKSFRIQIPEGREQATLLVGEEPIGVRILDESAGGFAVALVGETEIQQNQIHVLKTAAGVYKTRVARIEQFDDGKLLGLMRLDDVSPDEDEPVTTASWSDYLLMPKQATGMGGGIAAGICGMVVIAVLICGLAFFCLR